MKLSRYDFAAFASMAAYAAGSVVVPVAMVELAADLGFTLGQGGMTAAGGLHLARTVTLTGAMLACGFLAARWGKRRTVGFSVFLMAAGVAACAAAPGYGVLLLAIGIAGLGEGGVEALATPFVETLHPQEPGRYINLTHAFWSAGVVVAVLGTGWWLAAGGSWRWAVLVVAGGSAVAALLVLQPPGRGAAYPEAAGKDAAGAARESLAEAAALARSGRFWLFFGAMALAGGGEFCLTFWVSSYAQLGFGGGPLSGGFALAAFAGGMFLGRAGWALLLGDHHLRPLLLGSTAAGVLLTAGLPLVHSLPLLFVLLFLAGVAVAPYWPSVQALAARCLKREDPTVLFVLLSCAGVPGCGVFTWAMGWLGDATGLRAAFFLVPACFLGLGVLMALASTRGPSAETAGSADGPRVDPVSGAGST